MSDDFVITYFAEFLVKRCEGLHADIADSSALKTAYMIMFGQRPIESLLRSGEFQFFYQTLFTQDFEVAINGAQTDLRQPAPNLLINDARRRMGIILLQLFQNNLSLPRHP